MSIPRSALYESPPVFRYLGASLSLPRLIPTFHTIFRGVFRLFRQYLTRAAEFPSVRKCGRGAYPRSRPAVPLKACDPCSPLPDGLVDAACRPSLVGTPDQDGRLADSLRVASPSCAPLHAGEFRKGYGRNNPGRQTRDRGHGLRRAADRRALKGSARRPSRPSRKVAESLAPCCGGGGGGESRRRQSEGV